VKARTLLISTVCLLVAVGLGIIWFGRSSPISPIRVTLLGTTNNASGSVLYRFEATNTAKHEFIVSYQTQILPGPGEDGVRPAASQKSLFVFYALIVAESTREFSFPAPQEEASAWRVALFYDDHPRDWRRHLHDLFRRFGVPRRYYLSTRYVYSDRIPTK